MADAAPFKPESVSSLLNDSRRREMAEMDTPKEQLERSFAPTGSGARNRNKRKMQVGCSGWYSVVKQ